MYCDCDAFCPSYASVERPWACVLRSARPPARSLAQMCTRLRPTRTHSLVQLPPTRGAQSVQGSHRRANASASPVRRRSRAEPRSPRGHEDARKPARARFGAARSASCIRTEPRDPPRLQKALARVLTALRPSVAAEPSALPTTASATGSELLLHTPPTEAQAAVLVSLNAAWHAEYARRPHHNRFPPRSHPIPLPRMVVPASARVVGRIPLAAACSR